MAAVVNQDKCKCFLCRGGYKCDSVLLKEARVELAAAMRDTARLNLLSQLIFNGDINIYFDDHSIRLRYRDSGTHRCETDGSTLRAAIDATQEGKR